MSSCKIPKAIRPKVLIVEDSASMQGLYEALLQRHYQVLTADTLASVRDILDKHLDIAVVICDWKLAEEDSLPILNEIHQRSPLTSCALVTAYPSIDLVQDVLNQDLAFRFLDKKRAADDLWSVVQQCQSDHDEKRQAQSHAPVEFIAHWLRSVFTQVPQMEALAERFCQVTDWISQESDPDERRSVRLAARLFPAGMLNVSVDIIRDVLLGRPINETMWKTYRQHVAHTTALARMSAELQPAGNLLERALSAPLRSPHSDSGDGACTLRVAHDFCWLEYRLGSASALAVITSETSKGQCRSCAMAAEQISINLWDDPMVVEGADGKFRMVELCRQVHQLLPGDVLLDDLLSDNGRLVFARGSELTRGAIKTLVTLAEYQDMPSEMLIRRKVLLEAAGA